MKEKINKELILKVFPLINYERIDESIKILKLMDYFNNDLLIIQLQTALKNKPSIKPIIKDFLLSINGKKISEWNNNIFSPL